MTDSRDLFARAKAKIEGLSRADLEVLNQFLDAITAKVDFAGGESSWLTEGWFAAFTARLRAHHALSIEPLSTRQFEAAFNSACLAESWPTWPVTSATHRFFDTTVIGPDAAERRISLKASSAKDMKRDSVHISKLTEAAWIQDERTQAGRRNRLLALFREYRDATTSIVVLRAFGNPNAKDVLYELIEIPTTVFGPVDDLTIAEAQASTIPVPGGQSTPNFKIRIDRSDSKITLTNIRLAVCEVHGRWRIYRTE